MAYLWQDYNMTKSFVINHLRYCLSGVAADVANDVIILRQRFRLLLCAWIFNKSIDSYGYYWRSMLTENTDTTINLENAQQTYDNSDKKLCRCFCNISI